MRLPATTATTAPRTILTAAVVALIGWVGVIAIGAGLASSPTARLGFDFQLLLDAGRDVAAGQSPYASTLVGGSAPTATELFYSYPPPVAQAFALVGWLPDTIALLLWDAAAVVGLVVVADRLRDLLAPDRPRWVVAAVTFAVAPLTLPFAVGLLFGNLDVFFPLLYGTMLLGVLLPTARRGVAAGIAVTAAASKLHPASMGLWFLARAIRDRASAGWAGRVVVVAIVTGLAVIAVSVVVGGIGLWQDYADVVRSGTGAVIVDPRNAGPAAILASLVGGGDALARSIHLGVAILVVIVTLWAGWRRGDRLEGFAWAAAASLSTLPVTWYHYPSALLPVGIAAWLRAGPAVATRVRASLVAALVVGAVAIAWLPLLWAAIALVILAARLSRPVEASVDSATPVRPAPATG